HHSRFRPLSTVNFARKPRSPVSTPAGTISSDGITSLVVWPTALNYSVIPSEVEESGGVTFRLRLGQLRRRSAHHVNKVHSQLAESSMANKSARGPATPHNSIVWPLSVRRTADPSMWQLQIPPHSHFHEGDRARQTRNPATR